MYFEKYPMYGDKRLDFESFKSAAQIISSTKGHLTAEGIDAIYTIKMVWIKEDTLKTSNIWGKY